MTCYIALVLCIHSLPHSYVLMSIMTDTMGETIQAQVKQETRMGMNETLRQVLSYLEGGG
jgi:hypothetical protein